MRRLALMLSMACLLTGQGALENFPGAKVKNEAPFDQTTMMVSQSVCSNIYSDQDLIIQKTRVTGEVKACIAEKFPALTEVDFSFGTSDFSKCVVPDRAIRSVGGLPMWPVCCPVGRTNARQFLCVVYVVPGGK